MSLSFRRLSPRLTRVAVAIPLVAVVSLAVGCSSDKAAAPASTTSTTAGAKTGTTTSGVHATAGNEAYCQMYFDAVTKLNADTVKAAAASGQTNDTRSFIALIPEVKTTYQQVTEGAPSDIKPDFATLNARVQAVQTLDDLSNVPTPPDAKAADDRITAWTQTNCGFDPSKPSGS